METQAIYGGSSIDPSRLTSVTYWKPPEGKEIRTALQLAGWSGEEFARRIGVNGRTVRRWVLNEKPIAYTAWCILCIEAGLGKIWKN